MSDTLEVPASWLCSFTIADQLLIDAMDERQREVVERYVRACGSSSPVSRGVSDDEMCDTISEYLCDSIDVRFDVEDAVSSALRRFRKEGKL